MAETISMTTELPKFTTVKYTTKDGENITATKKDGIVTLVGDKNGIRELPLDDFIKKELPENLENVKLENSPKADTVEISKTEQPDQKQATEVAKQEPQTTEPEKAEVGKKLDIQV